MPNETETVTITQTAPDGTETKIEITQTPPEGADEQSLAEEIIEAIFDDTNGDGEITAEDIENASDSTEYSVSETEPTETEFVVSESEPSDVVFETQDSTSVEESTAPVSMEQSENVTYDPEIIIPTNYDTGSTPFVADNFDVALNPTVETTDTTSIDSAELAEQAELQAHADAARDAQEAADEFVAKGDYEAASQAREIAENEAWEAGDDSMLSGSNSTDLDTAATEQDNADYYRQQQEEFTAQGNYEAAQEAANKVIENTSDADWYASGDDHSTQARNEEYQLENAVNEEKNADWYATNAEEFAEQGNYDAASSFAEQAVEHQAEADYLADSTQDGSTFDASSQVESGGSYEAATDYSSAVDFSSDYDSATDYASYDTATTDFSSE